VIVALLLLAQNSTVTLDSYRVLDERTIGVSAGVAPCSWTRVTRVAESATDVQVAVETWPCPIPGPGTAARVGRELIVALGQRLGTRTVHDVTGRRIPDRSTSG
jgi:hypothetical protein